MASAKIAETKLLIDNIIGFLKNYTALSEGHMVDFFTKNLYKTCIPHEIQNEIYSVGYEETVKSILNSQAHTLTPILNEYITKAKNFSLYNAKPCLNFSEFKAQLAKLNDRLEDGLKLEVFMKSKKAHEVEILSAVAASVAKIAKTSHLIDIGDGKGYLSSLLAIHHKIPVLGVDASYVNTTNAIERCRRLLKHWHHINKKPKETEIERYYSEQLYKQVTQLVTEKTNFDEIVTNVFLQENNGLGLVGLHTCGNLGPTSVRIFNSNENIKSICNVSCCYHLLNEKYLANQREVVNVDDCPGFPMSDYLRTQGIQLCRAVRMLSAQSIDRILHKQELPNKIIFYRAIFEVVLTKFNENHEDRHVGKYRREPENFVEYSREALKRVGVEHLSIDDNELEEFYENFKEQRIQLNIFHLIRSMLAPVIESLILLDRYLYLLEEGHENVFLVQLFDPVISPRCYGLIAFKN